MNLPRRFARELGALVGLALGIAACIGADPTYSATAPIVEAGTVTPDSSTALPDGGAAPDAASVVDGSPLPEAGRVGPLEAPRLKAPVSGLTVASGTPSLAWVLAAGADGAHVEICAARDCAKGPEVAFDLSGSGGRVPTKLAPGVHFWRATARAGDEVGQAASATWELVVPHPRPDVTPTADGTWGMLSDVNGDGLADVVATNGAPDYGRSFSVYLAKAGKGVDASTARAIVTAPAPYVFASVAIAGDVDGDGFVDVAAGGYTLATPTAWSVFVYRGGPTGIAAAPSYTMVSPDGTPFSDPAGLGDVDGDGFSDLGIAASDDPRAGHAYVVRGAASGPSTAAAWTLTPDPGSLAGFGAIVTRVGDLDADGFADFVESTCCSQGQAAQLYRGGASGPVRVAGTFPVGAGRGTGSGDVNGDGYADMTMSNSFAASGQAQVYGFFGGKTLGAVVAWQVVAPGAATIYQGGTAHADFDGDGIVDLLVTLPGYDGLPDGGTGGVVGRAHVFLGKAGGTGYADADLKATLEAATPADAVLGGGWLTGDMDGDGRDDIALGTRFRNAVAVYRGIPQNTTAAFLTGDADGLGMSLAH